VKNSSAKNYLFSAATSVLAILVRLALTPIVGDRAPLALPALAVIASARYGRGPGFLATAIGALIGTWLLPRPHLPVLDDFLVLILFLTVSIVITLLSGERRDALQRSEDSEQRYRGISEALPHLIWTCTPDGECDHVNTRWTSYTGVPAEKQLGHGWLEQVHPEDHPKIARQWREAGKFGAPFQLEFRIRRYDGVWHLFDARAVPLKAPDGTIVKWVGSNTDIQLAHELWQSLRREAERFSNVAETVPGFIFSFHLSGARSGAVPYASAYLKDLCGIAPESVHDDVTPFFDRIHPDDLDRVWSSIHESARRRVPWRTEFRFHHPDKGEVWIEGVARPGQSEHESLPNWYGVMMDVTARRQAQETSREWERAFEQTELGIALSTVPSETIRAVNVAFARERGYDPQELAGRPSAIVYPRQEWARLAEVMKAADHDSGHIVAESFQQRKDSSTFPVLVDLTAVRDASGRIVSRVAIMQDLTERKRIEAERQRTEALYRAICGNLPDSAVFVVDRDLRYVAVAGPLAAGLGFPREAVEGRTLAEVIPEERYIHALDRFVRAFAGESYISESTVNDRALSTHYVPLRDGDDKVVAAMAICQDITSRRRAEEEIRQLNEDLEMRVRDRTIRLEAANQELEAFAYSVSHDLRAPLRGIDGWAEALREDMGDTIGETIGEKGLVYLDRIRAEAQRMAVLIDGLLDLSRLTRAEMRWLPVDLTALAQRHAALLAEANPDRRIVFHVQPGLTAYGDVRLLEAVVANLMGNAVKFTRPRAEATVEVGQRQNGDETEFYVRDNGVGFEMSHSTHLFGAFQRLHKASDFPGTGIGLATVQRVIHRHGGRVWADARKGEGATFRFTLGSFDRKALHAGKGHSAD
jgi:PAS domain S-box-containing protein